jgi:hypothetical protein
MALAQRNNLLLLLSAESVGWPLRSTRVINESTVHGLERTLTEFVEVAAADPERGGNVRCLLSSEQRHDCLESLLLFGTNMV